MNENRLHHLSFDRSKATWKLRLRVRGEGKFVSKEFAVSLGSCDESTAIQQRDLIIKAFDRAGVAIEKRKLARHKKSLKMTDLGMTAPALDESGVSDQPK